MPRSFSIPLFDAETEVSTGDGHTLAETLNFSYNYGFGLPNKKSFSNHTKIVYFAI